MQKSFQVKLTGGTWFKLFIIFYIVTAAFVGLCIGLFIKFIAGEVFYSLNYTSIAILCVAFILYILFILGWVIPLYQKWINKMEFDGKPFKFHGKIGEFIKLNLAGILLTAITLCIYLPWYLRNLMKYISNNVEYNGARLDFNGAPGKLLVRFVWAFYIPLIALTAFSAAFHTNTPGNTVPNLLYQCLSQILFLPFTYVLYQWYFNNLSYRNKTTHWNTSFWPSLGMMLGQTLLTFVTIFIYWPAAVLRIYRYFAARTEVIENGKVIGRFEFQGKIGKGFLLIWGQLLLCIVTLLIYLPWAVAKVYKWILEETKYISA